MTRVVSIKLVADASGLSQALGRVSEQTKATSKSLADSARNNREAWATVGTGLTAVGVAITGIGVAALKTGVQYNTLQQTTRAALTTLLGSAQAANAQMDKLDDFARNSPFAKQTFIQAQQQMLAFGIETQKVLPYLDAVQNAVAAMGGSNQEIEAIATIMSKISSSAKITATDLMQFGNHGVDAAALIGSQMGKTAGQIREDITAGALDAGVALDALAAGMQQKFGGAADNVKNTFAGAMDRVKAAWRDFASELAKPLVDPNGGGALVDLLNWTADAMRGFQALPEPVKNLTSNLVGLTGVVALLGGGFMLALPKVLAFNAALATLGVTRSSLAGGLKDMWQFLISPWGIALVAAATALHVFQTQMEESKATAQELEMGIKQGSDAFKVMREESEKGWNVSGIYNLTSRLDDLDTVLEDNVSHANSFTKWLTQDFDDVAAIDTVRELGSALASMSANDLPRAQKEFARFGEAAGLSREQLALALDEMPEFKAALISAAEAAGIATDDTTLLAIAMGEVEPAAEANKKSLESIQGAAVATSESVSDLAAEILNFGSAAIDSERAAIAFEEELANLNEQVASGAAGLDISTEAGRTNRDSLLDLANATNKSAAATLEATGNQEAATATLHKGRDALIAAAIQYGMTEAEAKSYADQILATPDTVATWAEMHTATAKSVFESFLESIRGRSVTVRADVQTFGNGYNASALLRAQGGTIGYAGGGTILSAASGRSILGFGGGVASGTVFGQGTETSDSVLVRLSKGEEVIRASQAEKHRPLLKSINRGDFMPSMMLPQTMMQQPAASGGHSGPVVVRIGDREFEGWMDERASGVLTGATQAIQRPSLQSRHGVY